MLGDVIVEGTLHSIGSLGKGTSIISVVGAAFAQRCVSHRSVQGNTRMTVGFENCSTMGTSNSCIIDELMAAGTIRHRLQDSQAYRRSMAILSTQLVKNFCLTVLA